MLTPAQRLRSALESGRSIHGSVVFEFAGPSLPALAAESGADFLWLDMENTAFSLRDIRDTIQACNHASIAAIVRIPEATQTQLAGKLVDFGAAGVMAPGVQTRREAEKLVAATRYPPRGTRGVANGGQTLWRRPDSEQREAAPLVLAQIESVEGVAAADTIAAVDGLDVLWIGQRDLSVSIGQPESFDTDAFQDAVRRVAAAATKAEKFAGYVVEDAHQVQRLLDYGYRCFAISNDLALYRSGLRHRLDRVTALTSTTTPVSA